MSLGYDQPLYLLAFDHRGSFEKGLLDPATRLAHVKAGIIDAKELIFEAHLDVVRNGLVPLSAAGILVDEEFGASVARKAKAEGTPLAMPVESSGQDEFQFEYGDDFGQHIENFDPSFAKVLVRYNPQGDVELNKRQNERLTRLSRWLREHQRQFSSSSWCLPQQSSSTATRTLGPMRKSCGRPRRRGDPCSAGSRRRARYLEGRGYGSRGGLSEGCDPSPQRRP